MSFEAIHPAGYSQSAKGFSPRDRIGFVAAHRRQGIWSFHALPNDPVDTFLNIDEGLLHVNSPFYSKRIEIAGVSLGSANKV
jgi:hypothetical protein